MSAAGRDCTIAGARALDLDAPAGATGPVDAGRPRRPDRVRRARRRGAAPRRGDRGDRHAGDAGPGRRPPALLRRVRPRPARQPPARAVHALRGASGRRGARARARSGARGCCSGPGSACAPASPRCSTTRSSAPAPDARRDRRGDGRVRRERHARHGEPLPARQADARLVPVPPRCAAGRPARRARRRAPAGGRRDPAWLRGVRRPLARCGGRAAGLRRLLLGAASRHRRAPDRDARAGGRGGPAVRAPPVRVQAAAGDRAARGPLVRPPPRRPRRARRARLPRPRRLGGRARRRRARRGRRHGRALTVGQPALWQRHHAVAHARRRRRAARALHGRGDRGGHRQPVERRAAWPRSCTRSPAPTTRRGPPRARSSTRSPRAAPAPWGWRGRSARSRPARTPTSCSSTSARRSTRPTRTSPTTSSTGRTAARSGW